MLQRLPLAPLRKADAFKTICQAASVVPNFFAAEVPVQRFNEKENDEATGGERNKTYRKNEISGKWINLL